MRKKVVECQRYHAEYYARQQQVLRLFIKHAVTQGQSQSQSCFPAQEVRALRRAALAVAAQLDEEQQIARSNDTHAQAHQHRTDGRLWSHQQYQLGGQQQQQSTDYLALQFSITEYKALGQQCQQEATHHQRIEYWLQRHAQQQPHHRADQQEVDEQDGAVRQEKTVERSHVDTLFRRKATTAQPIEAHKTPMKP